MQLIGLLDSPYVRRVAVSLQYLQLPFEHQAISVFRGFERFQTINPLVKAPTLVCDDGTVLMDSTLILQYAESLVAPRTLTPQGPALLPGLRVIGLALVMLEKSVQIVYERELRPPDRRHAPWVERVTGQLLAAATALEAHVARHPLSGLDRVDQAGLTTAVGWHFVQQMVPDLVPVTDFPQLQTYSLAMEQQPEFKRAPHGTGTFPCG